MFSVPRQPIVNNSALANIFNNLVKDDQRVVSDENTADLLNLSYKTGQPVLSMENTGFVYQVIAWLRENNFKVVYSYLTQLSQNVDEKPIFNAPFMTDVKSKVQRDDELFELKGEKIDTGFSCPKCKSNDINTVEKQVRAADEAFKLFLSCNSCTFKWTMN